MAPGDEEIIPRPSRTMPLGLMIALALLSTIAPLAMDLYLPAFPEMQSDLRTTGAGVQLTMTAFLFGLAIGQLLFGWLADHLGRRGPLLIGTALCAIVTVIAALAPDVETLIAVRSIQGFTGAAGVVIGRAIVTDLTRGDHAARTMSLIQSLAGVVAVSAPMFGGFLAPAIHWRGIMWVLVGAFVTMLVVSAIAIPETAPRRRQGFAVERPGHGRLRDLLNTRFLLYVATFVFASGVLMAYISASPFVYQNIVGWNQAEFGIAFGVNAIFNILGGLISARLVRRYGAHRILGVGLGLLLVLSLTILALGLCGAGAWTFLPLPLLNLSIGMCFGNATALALGEVRRVAGSGSALLGSTQYIVGGIAAGLVGIAGESTTLGLGLTVTGAAIVAGICYFAAGWIRLRPAVPQPTIDPAV